VSAVEGCRRAEGESNSGGGLPPLSPGLFHHGGPRREIGNARCPDRTPLECELCHRFERILPIAAGVGQTLVDLRKHSFRRRSRSFPLVTDVVVATPRARIAGTRKSRSEAMPSTSTTPTVGSDQHKRVRRRIPDKTGTSGSRQCQSSREMQCSPSLGGQNCPELLIRGHPHGTLALHSPWSTHLERPQRMNIVAVVPAHATVRASELRECPGSRLAATRASPYCLLRPGSGRLSDVKDLFNEVRDYWLAAAGEADTPIAHLLRRTGARACRAVLLPQPVLGAGA